MIACVFAGCTQNGEQKGQNLDMNYLDAEASTIESQARLSLKRFDSYEDNAVTSINTPVNGRVDDTGSTVVVTSDDERGCAVRGLSFSLSAGTIQELMKSDVEHMYVMEETDDTLSETCGEEWLRRVADMNGNVTSVESQPEDCNSVVPIEDGIYRREYSDMQRGTFVNESPQPVNDLSLLVGCTCEQTVAMDNTNAPPSIQTVAEDDMNGPPSIQTVLVDNMNGPPSIQTVLVDNMNGPPSIQTVAVDDMNGPPSIQTVPVDNMNGPPSIQTVAMDNTNAPPSIQTVAMDNMNGPPSIQTVAMDNTNAPPSIQTVAMDNTNAPPSIQTVAMDDMNVPPSIQTVAMDNTNAPPSIQTVAMDNTNAPPPKQPANYCMSLSSSQDTATFKYNTSCAPPGNYCASLSSGRNTAAVYNNTEITFCLEQNTAVTSIPDSPSGSHLLNGEGTVHVEGTQCNRLEVDKNNAIKCTQFDMKVPTEMPQIGQASNDMALQDSPHTVTLSWFPSAAPSSARGSNDTVTPVVSNATAMTDTWLSVDGGDDELSPVDTVSDKSVQGAEGQVSFIHTPARMDRNVSSGQEKHCNTLEEDIVPHSSVHRVVHTPEEAVREMQPLTTTVNRIVNEYDYTKTCSDCKNQDVTPTLTTEISGNEPRQTKVYKAEKQVHTYTEIPLTIDQLLEGYRNVAPCVLNDQVIVTAPPHATTEVFKDVKFELEIPTNVSPRATVCIEGATFLPSIVCPHVLPNTRSHDSAMIERSLAAMNRLGTLIVGENCHVTTRNKDKLDVTMGVTDEHCDGNREKNKEKCESHKLQNDRARNRYNPSGKKMPATKRLDALIHDN